MAANAFRKKILLIHRWAGLFLLIPIIVISITGAILVFERELDVALNQHLWKAQESATRLTYDEVIAIGAQLYPDDPIASLYPPAEQGLAIMARTQNGMSIFIDPATGAVNGVRSYSGAFFRVVTDLHLSFLIPGEIGADLTGAVAIAMALFIVTGLYLWWPRRGAWRFAFALRPKTPKIVTMFDWHRLAGFYSAAILLPIAVTGILISFQSIREPLFYGLTKTTPPNYVVSVPPAPGPNQPVETLVANAMTQLPPATIYQIALPAQKGEALRLRLRAPREPWWIGRAYAYIDPSNGDIVSVINASNGEAPAVNAESWIYHLHLGHWGEYWNFETGVATRTLWFVAALIPTVLSVTGLLLWWWRRRLRPKSKRHVQPRAKPQRVEEPAG
jgi:uncharacterized iron-regulated membrane protein